MEDGFVLFGSVCEPGRKMAEPKSETVALRGASLRLCPERSGGLLLPSALSVGFSVYLFLGRDYFLPFVHIAVEYYLLH